MTIAPGSRYEEADRIFTTQHFYDVYGHPLVEEQDGKIRFVTNSVETAYLITTQVIPPSTPVDYYAKDTENLPFLGYKFFNDATRWWEIAEVNPDVWYPLDLKPGGGQFLRIPL